MDDAHMVSSAAHIWNVMVISDCNDLSGVPGVFPALSHILVILDDGPLVAAPL